MDETSKQILSALSRVSQLSANDTTKVYTFESSLVGSDGVDVDVTISVFEYAPGPTANRRYQCRAIDGQGKEAAGNVEHTIELAIEAVHWEDLGY